MNTHPIEYLPAFVLGGLDDATAHLVEAHLRECPDCRREAELFQQQLGSASERLPAPPPHLKRALMLRVHASRSQHQPIRGLYYSILRRPSRQVWYSVAAGALVLVLVFGAMMVDAQRRLGVAQQALQSLETTQALDTQQIATFLSNPQTVSEPLTGPQAGVAARMYMQAGHNRAVLLVSGLPKPAAGMTYQFWFATAVTQVPSGTFSVDAAGTARVIFDAPQPVDSYGEVMVTVEPSGGSMLPSKQVVLAAKLTAVLPLFVVSTQG